MSGSIHEANAMAGVGEKRSACAHASQMAAFAFEAQIFLDTTLLSYQTHQRLGLVGIELIGNEDPASLWIRLDGLGDVRGKIGFGARGSQARRHDLPAGPLQIGNQT